MNIINQAQTCSSAASNSAYVSRQKAQGQTAQHSEAVNWFPLIAKKVSKVDGPVSRCLVKDSWRVQLSAVKSMPSCWNSEKKFEKEL
jgi:hypothetical protein